MLPLSKPTAAAFMSVVMLNPSSVASPPEPTTLQRFKIAVEHIDPIRVANDLYSSCVAAVSSELPPQPHTNLRRYMAQMDRYCTDYTVFQYRSTQQDDLCLWNNLYLDLFDEGRRATLITLHYQLAQAQA